MEVNTRRITRELEVLVWLVSALRALVDDGGRPPTFCPNPNDDRLTSFSVMRVPIAKIGAFFSELHEQLDLNKIGVMLDAIVLKALVYRSAQDAKEHSLKKTMFLNFSLSIWTRENIMRKVKAEYPEERFYSMEALEKILPDLVADAAVLQFEEEECEGPRDHRHSKRGRRSAPLRTPLIDPEKAMAVLDQFGLGGVAGELLPALGMKAKPKAAPVEIEDGPKRDSKGRFIKQEAPDA